MTESKAKKEARERWRKNNPSFTIALPVDDYEKLKRIAVDKEMTYHGLVVHIIMEWMKNNAS